MKILVTGGAGFIGSSFVLHHTATYPNDSILVVDKLGIGSNLNYLEPIKSKITFQEADIANPADMSDLVEKHSIDVIVNFAAETHVDRSIRNAVPFIHSNILGVQSLIEVCRSNPELRLLHISTDEVYGDISDDEEPRTVSDILLPSSPYSASKAAGEMLLISAVRTFDLRCCIVRPANNYGPHQYDEKFIPTVIRRALADQPIPIYGSGKNKRDWLYVLDHCRALEVLLQTDWVFGGGEEENSGHWFNISANDERANIDVAREIVKLLNKPESLLTFVDDRPGHDWRYATDTSPLRKLGWKPQMTFEDGIQKTIEWYKKQYT